MGGLLALRLDPRVLGENRGMIGLLAAQQREPRHLQLQGQVRSQEVLGVGRQQRYGRLVRRRHAHEAGGRSPDRGPGTIETARVFVGAAGPLGFVNAGLPQRQRSDNAGEAGQGERCTLDVGFVHDVERGEFVAGVRYKAWQPPSGLHPTIGVHTPLVFDIFDTWNRRAIGGCTYFSGHPGGRNYETFPVNANEAESRRIARFRDIGHTQGEFDSDFEETTCEYPWTLDLRKSPGC